MSKKIVFAFTFFVICLGRANLYAQSKKNDRYYFSVEYNYLYTTHGTRFLGPGLNVERDVDKHLMLGIGATYNICRLHYDNGLKLTRLRMLPIYTSLRYHVCESKVIETYILMRLGMTISHYNRINPRKGTEIVKVKEEGFYNYGGAGVKIKLSSVTAITIDGGIQNYKFSFDRLAINPRGFIGKAGLIFSL